MEDASARGLTDFYVSGGTVPLESPSYVERGADRALLEALSAGKFCYVLNSRQMGKSSLCVRTMARLNAAGVRSAFVDLTKIGGKNVTPDQWYAGLVVEVGRALGCRPEMLRNWQEERDVSPMQRFFSALRDVALEKIESPIVIFIDEIDATRSLTFSAGEFFAGIRECYNRRVHDAAYKRLTFCLLGVAVPGDLIADSTTTPFNIGERVVLADFTESEAAVLLPGLGSGENEVLQRILYWTHGHPFLTQSLAATAASRGDIHSAAELDRLTEELLFQAKARETNINLADVGNRILNGYPDPDQIAKYRADVLSLYERILKGQEVFDDESNRLVTVLKLSGIVRVEDRRLKIRNPIYERVFDRHWIRENMPGAELRRQRRAFVKGVVRTGLVAAAVLAVIGWLAWKATQERNRANYEVYVATMNLMRPTWEQNNLERMEDLLASTENNPARGWEWDFWHRLAHLETATYPKRLVTTGGLTYATTGKIYLKEDGRILEYSPDTGGIVDVMPAMDQGPGGAIPFSDGKRLLEGDGNQSAQVIDLGTRRRLAKLEDVGLSSPQNISSDGRWVVGSRPSQSAAGRVGLPAVIFDTETGQAKALPIPPIVVITVSPDGTMIAAGEVDDSRGTPETHVVVREFGSWKILSSFETVGSVIHIAFSPGSDRLAASTQKGLVQLWDLKSRKEISRTQATDGLVYYMEFSLDGTWLAASAVDRVGRLYDVSGTQLKLIKTFPDAAYLVISPDKSHLAAYYFSLRIYDAATYVDVPTARSGLETTNGVSVLAKKALARVRSGEKLYELNPLTGESNEVTWLPGRLLLMPPTAGTWGLIQRADGTLEIMDFDLRRSIQAFPKKTKIPVGLSQFTDGRRAVLVYPDKTFEIWDVTTGHIVKQVHCATAVSTVKASPDGHWLAVGLAGSALSIWDTTTWTERQLQRSGYGVGNLAFSPDGSRLLAATGNDNAEVWDVHSGRLIGKLIGHSQSVIDAAYSPDGRRIVTASADTTVRIWDAATLRELASFAGHKRIVIRARFTEDGNAIISVDDQGNAMMWLTKAYKK